MVKSVYNGFSVYPSLLFFGLLVYRLLVSMPKPPKNGERWNIFLLS
ncbi:hypothetical protein [Alkalibacterium sp.]